MDGVCTLEDVKRLVTKNKKEIKYYITLDNTDGTYDVVYRLKCSKQEAMAVFSFVIQQQKVDANKWRAVRVFDANDWQIAQES